MLQWLSGGHNGGCVKFGPDGYLYISTGDGGDPNPPDPFNTGQDISDLLSSILRIDVDHPDERQAVLDPARQSVRPYHRRRPEVWAYGLRNPWRMNFDRQTGNLWVGDVGWELWESVDCAKSGGNYGWSIMEGPNPVHPEGQARPHADHPRRRRRCRTPRRLRSPAAWSIAARNFRSLHGHYLFGDWQTQRLWAAKCNGRTDKLEPYRTIAQTDQRIVAFGEHARGRAVIVDHGGGGLWQIVRNPDVGKPQHFPHNLSETGLFTST